MRTKLSILLLLTFLSSYSFAQSMSELRMDAYGKLWVKDYTGAASAFDKLIQGSSSPDAEIYLNRGISLFLQGKFLESKDDFILAANSGSIDAQLWQARCYAALGMHSEAVSAITAYLKLNPKQGATDLKKDPYLKGLHDTEEWFMLWQNEWNTEDMLILNEALYYSARGNFAKAHEVIEDNLSSCTDPGSFYSTNAKIYASEGNAALALNEINYALSEQPGNRKFQIQKIDYLLVLEEYDDAYSILTKVVKRSPEDFDLRYQRAIVAMKADELNSAKEDIDLILKYSQEDDKVFLAGQISYAQGNYIDALRLYNKLLEKDSSKASYFKARGMTYYKTRTFKQAGYDLSMSLDLDPDDPEVNYYKGLTESALGDKAMACYYVNRARTKNYPPAVEYFNKNCSSEK